jgi:hypothetical protein
VLDASLDRGRRLAARLGAADRRRLESHLEAVRDVEKRLQAGAAPAAACARPAPPPSGTGGSTLGIEVANNAHADLVALALACDLTRVASLQWSWARSDVAMSWIGVRDSHHEMSHGKASPTLSSVNRWYAEQLARFATALDALGEGGASVLDNSVVWWCSDVSFGPLHSFTNLRAFLLGSCGGFFKTGQHIAFPGTTATINQLMVTFMRAMGIAGATQFGDPAVPPGALPGMG